MVPSTVCYGLARLNTLLLDYLDIYRVYIQSHRLLFEFDSIRFIYDIDTVELTRGVDFMLGCIYCLLRSRKVSHGPSRSCTIANTIIHLHGTRVSFFKKNTNHTQLSRIHSNGPSVTRIRPRLVRLFVRFTRMANRISRVFCVRQALNISADEKRRRLLLRLAH